MSIPKPGKPVRGSTTGAPLMALFDLLGRRWAMGVLWNLAPRGPSTFRGLQEACVSKSGTISPSILNTRIKELEEAKLLVRGLQGYELTPLGHELFDLLEPFKDWAHRWSRELEKN
ncbi:MAG TPA: helix-turn-helix domain-containing protein [Treponemataceae bacterium]|nr:helix-turn-helix domain-containing protein [Treponemataceae bacterium]